MSVPDTDFAFGGRLALDFTWTLRYRTVAPTELLARPSDLRRWISLAVAPVRTPVRPEHLAEAVRLREAVYAGALARIDRRVVPIAVRTVINQWASRPPPTLRLDPNDRTVATLRPGDEVESGLAAVARDAVVLFADRDGRLRKCAGPDCSLVFYDASRPGRRRWCAADRCGNRVNTSAYRRRRTGNPIRTRGEPHADHEAELRVLRSRSRSERGRYPHLLVRVHVVRVVRGAPRACLPELRRRTPHATAARRGAPRGVPGVHGPDARQAPLRLRVTPARGGWSDRRSPSRTR